VFSTFREIYSRYGFDQNIQLFVTEKKREKQKGYAKSEDDRKEKRGSRDEKMQRRGRGE
jgi:phage anti-repressor protein